MNMFKYTAGSNISFQWLGMEPILVEETCDSRLSFVKNQDFVINTWGKYVK